MAHRWCHPWIKKQRIMKKEYLKPEIMMEIVMLESMLALSPDSMGSNEEPGGPDKFNAADRREGNWGSFWD